MTGYRFRVDHVEYDATREGRPLTLVECLRATYGVAHASVLAPTGRPAARLPLGRAGSLTARLETRRGWTR